MVASAAMIALLDWRAFLLVIGTFLLVFLWKRIVSLASVVCAVAYPVYTFLLVYFFRFFRKSAAGQCRAFSLVSAVCNGGLALYRGTVLIKHRSNIGRLRRGKRDLLYLAKKVVDVLLL